MTLDVRPRFVLAFRPGDDWKSPRWALDFEFKESEHKRGQPENKGQFAKTSGGGTAKKGKPAKAERTFVSPNIGELTPVKQRAWSGKPNEGATRLTKLQAGDLGEKIVAAWLKGKGIKDAQPMNVQQKNFPVDLIGDHQVYEVKTGQVSTSAGAAQWRATIGQPGKQETEDLKHMTLEQKAAHNAAKNAAIMQRKNRIVAEYGKKLGHVITPKTITVIVDPDSGVADIHQFEGFHQRIGYNSPQAKQGFVGSFKYR